MTKKLPWRCTSAKQAKDKAEIYNSREWKELRIAKLQAQPLCEQCIKDGQAAGVPGGWIRAATCVHHIVPIELAKTKEEMRRLALECGLQGLMSLCQECHARIHKEMGSNTRRIVRERAAARQERWADDLINKFTTPK